MRYRSYEHYAIYRNYGRENEERVARGNEEQMRKQFEALVRNSPEGSPNLYLVRLTMVEAMKADKD